MDMIQHRVGNASADLSGEHIALTAKLISNASNPFADSVSYAGTTPNKKSQHLLTLFTIDSPLSEENTIFSLNISDVRK